jgi:hypothetical protein
VQYVLLITDHAALKDHSGYSQYSEAKTVSSGHCTHVAIECCKAVRTISPEGEGRVDDKQLPQALWVVLPAEIENWLEEISDLKKECGVVRW